jgi:YesN/AraC family two-component response regulator
LPNIKNVKNHILEYSKFNNLFYINNYYLNSNANLEDFALKLNISKLEAIEFINVQTDDSFSELIIKNRIKYFKQLLVEKKHESFTIEALATMSGFNNRQSMYNAFKKYENCSPSDFINSL